MEEAKLEIDSQNRNWQLFTHIQDEKSLLRRCVSQIYAHYWLFFKQNEVFLNTKNQNFPGASPPIPHQGPALDPLGGLQRPPAPLL